MAGWIETFDGYRIICGIIISVGLVSLLINEFFCRKSQRNVIDSAQQHHEESESRSSSEHWHLIKSESCSSSASAFADDSTEVYIKRLKYDSMNKYVKDW
jgi:hypothetical protein